MLLIPVCDRVTSVRRLRELPVSILLKPMSLKFPIGTRVGKKKPSANLSLPNKHGVVVGHGEKRNAKGALSRFYIVQPTHTARTEEWAPGITYALDDEVKDNIAFV